MSSRVVEEYMAVLHGFEVAVVSLARREPGLLDYDVEAALEALAARYRAEAQGRTPPPERLEGVRGALYRDFLRVAEGWMGRGPAVYGSPGLSAPEGPLGAGEIAACLKRLIRSVRRWNREGGRMGYLTFVRGYVFPQDG
jgi:hypothetical protein